MCLWLTAKWPTRRLAVASQKRSQLYCSSPCSVVPSVICNARSNCADATATYMHAQLMFRQLFNLMVSTYLSN